MPIPCRICGSLANPYYRIPMTRVEFAKEMEFYLCSRCGFCFAPSLDHVDKAAFYGPGYNTYDFACGRRGEREANIARWATDNWGNGGKRALSIGDSSGTGLAALGSVGFDAWSADFGATGERRLDLNLDIPAENYFDVITLIEVAEHFTEPLVDFTRYGRLLAPGGVLCGTTGCRDFAEICRDSQPNERWWYCNTKCCDCGHVSLYSLASMMIVAEAVGLRLRVHERRVELTTYMGQSQMVFYMIKETA